MCGICGMFSFRGAASESLLRHMNEQISRRGPDGAGHYTDGPVGLAMRRLAIIDLAGGQQPIFNETGSIAIVFNGEIYNYRALREEMIAKGHRFTTDSDTETIVHLYEEYGLDAPKHLQGMFAFAIWDRAAQRLVLARDRLGIKPLFIAQTADALLFGSEMKCILATGRVDRTIDMQAVDEYLSYTFVPCPRSIYRSIRQLAPGTVMTVQPDGTTQTHRYWSVPDAIAEERSEEEWLAECERALRDAVSSHLVSDVPVGAFLSGGVDSGVMVALMADIMQRPVETFTVGFSEAGSAFIDERRYARDLAARYKLNYHEVEVQPSLEAIVTELTRAFDQPFADDSVVPTYYISQIAGQKVKVALTGLGGDELFGGYRRHLGLLVGDRYARVPSWLRQGVIQPLVGLLPEAGNSGDTIDHLKRFTRAAASAPAERYQDSMATLTWTQRQRLYTPDALAAVDAAATLDVIRVPFESGASDSTLGRALRSDLQTYLVDDILTLTDRLSMWHSLELRVPYLDHRLVEVAARIPARLKIAGTTQKYLLKKLAERWLPRDMIYHKKQGFEAPMGRWLRGPLLPFFDTVVTRDAVDKSGIFRFDEIRRLRDDHVARRAKHSKVLFSVLCFLLWQAHPVQG